ncbi:hypothetical protein Hanom_Chr17g01528371 [Helianthus anomalus]
MTLSFGASLMYHDQWRSLKIFIGGSEVTEPKSIYLEFFFYKTGGSKTYIPKKFYTKRTYITLLSEKFSPPPPRAPSMLHP